MKGGVVGGNITKIYISIVWFDANCFNTINLLVFDECYLRLNFIDQLEKLWVTKYD